MSQELMQNRAHETTGATVHHTAEPGRFLLFKIGEEDYGVPLLQVREIICLMPITRVPGAPGHIRGVINLRGKVIPIVSLRGCFGMAEVSDTQSTCIVILSVHFNNRELFIGVVVDSVTEMREFKEQEMRSAPTFRAQGKTSYISGMVTVGDVTKTLLSVDALLTTTQTSH